MREKRGLVIDVDKTSFNFGCGVEWSDQGDPERVVAQGGKEKEKKKKRRGRVCRKGCSIYSQSACLQGMNR